MKNNSWDILWGCCLSLVILLPGQGEAAIKLGQSNALTGSYSFVGQDLHKGAMTYFMTHARDEIELLVKDDGYEPSRSSDNTESFIREGVDALFGYFGTPTGQASLPLAMQNEKIYFSPFTGAAFFSDVQKYPYSFPVRASYDAEVENMIRHLKEDLGVTRIGLFVQRDAFGMAGVRAAAKAQEIIKGIQISPPIPNLPSEDSSMDEWNEFWKSVPNYRRNTVSVGGAVRQVRGQAVEAVILFGASRPCAVAINQWHKIGFNVPMMNISFVGSKSLVDRLRNTDNVYISQVVPDPWDSSIPIVKEYQQDMGSAAEYDFASLEGYLSAKVFHKALMSVQGEVTTSSLKEAIESMSKYDAGGVEVSFSKDDHRGLDSVYLTKVDKAEDVVKFTFVDTVAPVEK